MNKRNWKIVYANYRGMEGKAIDLVSAEVGKTILRDKGVYTLYVLACEKFGCKLDSNIIAIGLYQENPMAQSVFSSEEVPKNGYAIKVCNNPEAEDLQMVVITAWEEKNLFYGAVDFVDEYLPSAAPYSGPAGGLRTPYETFNHKLPEYEKKSFSRVKTRSIFTWGHPINDYRKYIENIARLKINQLIVWNDFLPINAKAVVDYAHEYGIELIWGFPWGWGTDCSKIDFEKLDELRESIVTTFRDTYNGAGDGIYFQSFTELEQDYIGDVLIAEAVTDFVNRTAKDIYAINPDVHIQFGLHALSVKNHIEFFENVDERIEIIWEDCGTFPYHYRPETANSKDFQATLDFTERIIKQRNFGQVGLVYKGMMTMDWTKFEHQCGPYVLGRAADELIQDDINMLTPIWKYFQAEWMKSGKYVWDFTRCVNEIGGGNVNLCIAGALDGGIWFPEALCAELMWNCDEDYQQIIERVAKKPCVTMV